MDKCKALAHPLPTLAALAPTSSPLQQQRFFAKATSPAPEPSRIVPSSQAIRRRNSPVKYREVPTEQSDEQQRSTPASGQDADGGVLQSVEVATGRLATRAQLRDVGVHPLLGTLQEGAMGGEAQNGQGPTQPSVERDWPMVPEEPAQESARAARGTESQVARPLCLLRHHRERSVIGAVPARGPPTMAQMAQPTGRANTDDVGAVRPCAERLSPPCGASRAQCVPLSSETIVRGAGCLNWASPDLWEPRVGNCPRPPGRCANPYLPGTGAIA